jgi:hypothetical protein
MTQTFVKAGSSLVPLRSIESIDLSRIEQGIARVTYDGGKTAEAQDFDAFEIVMLLAPAAIEGRRLRWAKNAWAFHNLIAHPLMQIMVWLGFRRQALRLHDATVPRPLGIRKS